MESSSCAMGRAAVAMLSILIATSGCANTAMLVPAGSRAPQLEDLSRRTNVMADVITVRREEHRLWLDGTGGGMLSGSEAQYSTETSAAKVTEHIPFDELAVVYYRAGGEPVKDGYPLLAAVSARERRSSCADLDSEIDRAGAIRWYARRQGAKPFTPHQAHVKQVEYFLIGAGIVALITLTLAACGESPSACGGINFGAPSPPPGISPEAFRWAVTAADRREIGLLEIKRAKSCPARLVATPGESDFAILDKIEASREALHAATLTDQQQLDRQTELLDAFDPPPVCGEGSIPCQ